MAVSNFYITATEDSYSTTNNTSSVTVKVYIVTDSYSYNQLSPSGTLTISGNASATYSFSHSFNKSSTTCLVSKSFTVKHNDDGSGSITASASFKTGISAGTVTATKTLTLTKIPRASTPSISGTAQLGSTITISTNRASSSFTHTLTWAWSGKSGTIATNVGASTTWTPAIATFAPYLTDAVSATCTITCTTYNGSTSVGSKTKTFTLSIPSSVVPSISAVTPSDANGYLTKYGAYVKSKSSIKVATTAAGIYGSTIASYSVSMDGKSGASANCTLGAPPTAGTRTITVSVTDTRGRSASTKKTISVADYSVPSILKASGVRWSGDQEDDESTTVRITYAGTFTNVNSSNVNSKNIKIRYKLKSATTWSEKTVSNSSYNPSSYVDISGFDNSYTYDVQVVFSDDFANITKDITVFTAAPLMDFKAGGTGMAIGKVTENDAFEIGMKTLVYDEICFALNERGEGTTPDGTEVYNIQPVSENGNCVIGYGNYDRGEGNTNIYGNGVNIYTKEGVYIRENDLYMGNNYKLYTAHTDGNYYNAFQGCNSNGNLVIGYGMYDAGVGGTNIYGDTIRLTANNPIVSNRGMQFDNARYLAWDLADGSAAPNCIGLNANNHLLIGYGLYSENLGETHVCGKDLRFHVGSVGGVQFLPYYKAGTEVSNTIYTGGFITSSGTKVYFNVPLMKPVIGNPTVTCISVDGFILRQDGKYTHGSAASTWVKPTSYECTLTNYGVRIQATFSSTTNAINNAPTGVSWSGIIQFS